MRKAGNFKVAEEIVDVRDRAVDAGIVIFAPLNGYDLISLVRDVNPVEGY
jgi:hypothetical protein